MSKKIYETREWKGHGRQEYYHNEYELEDDKSISKYKCHRIKSFDSDGSYWDTGKEKVESWEQGDSETPSWLSGIVNKLLGND